MTKKLLFVAILSMLATPLFSQMMVWQEDFETDGDGTRYTSSNEFYDPVSDDDYFGRVFSDLSYYDGNVDSGFDININAVAYTGFSGQFYMAAEDLNDTGGTIGNPDGVDFKDVSFTGISIAGGSNLQFRGLFARGDTNPCGASRYDITDFVELYYNVDGAGEVTAMRFSADLECNIPGDTTNEPLHHDPDMDGDGGEGTILSENMQEFTFNIPDGNTLDLRIRVRVDAGSEEFAFDNFRLFSDTTLSTTDVNLDNSITLYPNPSNGKITIEKGNTLELSNATVYSILGAKVASFDLSTMNTSKILDLTNLKSGIYMIKILGKDGAITTKKIIIE